MKASVCGAAGDIFVAWHNHIILVPDGNDGISKCIHDSVNSRFAPNNATQHCVYSSRHVKAWWACSESFISEEMTQPSIHQFFVAVQSHGVNFKTHVDCEVWGSTAEGSSFYCFILDNYLPLDMLSSQMTWIFWWLLLYQEYKQKNLSV